MLEFHSKPPRLRAVELLKPGYIDPDHTPIVMEIDAAAGELGPGHRFCLAQRVLVLLLLGPRLSLEMMYAALFRTPQPVLPEGRNRRL